jgi:malate dehydrogenase (oxaloacetate-decarboxylating)(NADP+)
MVRLITNRAKIEPKRMFCRSRSFRRIKAAQIAYEEGICHPILLGSKEIILEPKEELGFMLNSLLILKK